LAAISFQGIAKGAIHVGLPSRIEIKKLAEKAFAIAHQRIVIEYAEKQNQVLERVRLTGNSGGDLPALTKWGAERLRKTILAHAKAYVKAFNKSGIPSDVEVEKALERSSLEIAAGTISHIRGQLNLNRMRNPKQRPPEPRGGVYIGREIEKSRVLALAEGKLKLEGQRIKTATSDSRVGAPPKFRDPVSPDTEPQKPRVLDNQSTASFSPAAQAKPPGALEIISEAMIRRSLNVPKLAAEIRALLRRKRVARLKADRATIFRIVCGDTKWPNPALRDALIEVLQLPAAEAEIVRHALMRPQLQRAKGPKK
jgi:hypothetical protein